jgi:hypothetical protein
MSVSHDFKNKVSNSVSNVFELPPPPMPPPMPPSKYKYKYKYKYDSISCIDNYNNIIYTIRYSQLSINYDDDELNNNNSNNVISNNNNNDNNNNNNNNVIYIDRYNLTENKSIEPRIIVRELVSDILCCENIYEEKCSQPTNY